eukprot:GILI01007171.1.p1 GENE.GILI01007171.1~~GILI01007171.1.p1  ORF type:complete len:681 (+),score=241.50 GILI01007171.1:67-2109(+)
MSTSEGFQLSQSIVRNLTDRSYDKRKAGALEIEANVKQLWEAKQDGKIRALMQVLVNDFVNSATANARKGGLIGLAATSIGLMGDIVPYLDILLPPVLKCFGDQDSRVRYYACEALYNISKVARSHVLGYFNDIFDGLCKLFADVETDVKNGAQLLDRLIKDIVTESEKFNVVNFIPLLKERIRVINPYIRQLLVSWITVLDSIPDIDMLQFLPEFLAGLFNMLSDANRDIRQAADSCLSEFLREIKRTSSVDLGPMVRILVVQCRSKEKFCRLTALTWTREFIELGGEQLLVFYADVLGAILTCISDQEEEIRRAADETNEMFLQLVQRTTKPFEIKALVTAITSELNSQWVPTRTAALKWNAMLLVKNPDSLLSFLGDLSPALLKRLSDAEDEVVLMVLEVLARIALHPSHFSPVLQSILALFGRDRRLLETRGSLIIRQLCVLLDAEKIYRTFSQILENEENLEFACQMVQTLNLILLTSVELMELRSLLKQSLQAGDKRGVEVLTVLHRSWCHNPVATVSLCLLSQAYELATHIVNKFAEMEMTVSMLVQIDKLVQLIESPIFVHLRLQLLSPEEHPYLLRALYGLLMLLPQSKAFKTLNTRLSALSALPVLAASGGAKEEKSSKKGSSQSDPARLLDSKAMLQHFDLVQGKHSAARRQALQLWSLSGRSPLKTEQ